MSGPALTALTHALDDLNTFAVAHGAHGGVDADVARLSAHGYRLSFACDCGGRLDRWITRRDVAVALAQLDAEGPEGADPGVSDPAH